jgi:hypothetical protein
MTRRPLIRILSLALVASASAALVGCMPEGYQDIASVEVTVSGSSLTVAGWAWDQDTPTAPIDVHIYVDDHGIAVRADGNRPDVAAVKPAAGPNHGYVASMNVAAGSHRVCSYAINAPGTSGDNVLLGCKRVQVVAPSTTTTTVPAPTTTEPTVPNETAWAAEVVAAINVERADAGLAALSSCPNLTDAAQAYSATMATSRWFDTTGPDGSEPWTRVSAYDGTAVGEDISFGFVSSATMISTVMGSTTSSANLLEPEFSHIGVGRTLGDPDGSGPAAPGYFVVQEFGTGGTC